MIISFTDLQMKFSNEFCKDVDDVETELCEGLTNKQQGKGKRQSRKIMQKEDISAHHIPRVSDCTCNL